MFTQFRGVVVVSATACIIMCEVCGYNIPFHTPIHFIDTRVHRMCKNLVLQY